MTSTPVRAAIYARISSDTDGTRAGVDRQLADCHTLATSLGWSVAQEYVDNDISAYSGKRRPEYHGCWPISLTAWSTRSSSTTSTG
jgi:site-specific DNA recombinase